MGNVCDTLEGLRIKDEHLAAVLRGEEFLLLDGAMGTMMQAAGLAQPGVVPDLLNLTHPADITAIHAQYVAAGTEAVTTNTFGANRLKLAGAASVADVYRAAADCVRAAGARYVVGDIGPTGSLLEPMGEISFEEAYDVFAEQARAAQDAGCDILLVETVSDLLEAKAALLAVREQTNLPVFVTMTFEEDGRTFLGTPPEVAALTLSSMGAQAVGANCSLGPAEMLPTVEAFCRYSRVPVMVQPNAGLPRMEEGRTVYDVTPEDFARAMEGIIGAGASIVGGCCGTDPRFIRGLASVVAQAGSPKAREIFKGFALTSAQTMMALDNGSSHIAVIGERINPTGKPKLKAALRAGDLDYLVGEAVGQQANGADVLDVNVGLPEIDEPAVLRAAVSKLQATCPLPLVIDSSDIVAVEKAVRSYAGKPLINSVNGKEENLAGVLPIAKRYGACVIGLTLDESGIPPTAEGRFAIASRIVGRAEALGIPRQDVVIDCLTMSVATNQDEAPEILAAIRRCKQELGVRTTLGVSNISFGLPQRNLMSSTFLAAAFGAGLDLPIINPSAARYRDVITSYRVLCGQDRGAAAYISDRQSTPDPYDGAPTATEPAAAASADASGGAKKASVREIPVPGSLQDVADQVREAQNLILTGRKGPMASLTESLLADHDPLSVIDGVLIPTLDEVGLRFDEGSFFLPQLMASAEAVKVGFDVVKKHMGDAAPSDGGKMIALATVQGDIHDIGKNIVKMLLENYGYTVLDLGKDVNPQAIVDVCEAKGVRLVGLSALMTTTVRAMERTIELLHERLPEVKVFVGGAVLTAEYAKQIGADYYTKDAAESARVVEDFFS